MSLAPKGMNDSRPVLLHVGSGPKGNRQLHSLFQDPARWQEIRLDVDPGVAPDILCSVVDLRSHIADSSVDAIWCSHNIEHLHDHEARQALAEFRRVLHPEGFVLIRTPDLNAIIEAIQKNGLESPAYMSPAGEITPLDMLYGHRPSVERGNTFMAHHTVFDDTRLAELLLEAGFAEVRTRSDDGFDLWAVGFREQAPVRRHLNTFLDHGLSFME